MGSEEPKTGDPKLAELQAKLDEALVASKRWQAEFVNYQQRVARERESDRKYAVEGLVREMLPALDTVQQAMARMEKDGAAPGLVEAVKLIEKELLRVLGRAGVRPIEAAGAFDPNLHDALAAVETADLPEGAIVEVLRAGYMMHDRVLRPVQVNVARKPATGA